MAPRSHRRPSSSSSHSGPLLVACFFFPVFQRFVTNRPVRDSGRCALERAANSALSAWRALQTRVIFSSVSCDLRTEIVDGRNPVAMKSREVVEGFMCNHGFLRLI